MNSGYYAAFSGLLARTHALDLAANNLANANTAGYKAQRGFYQSLLASTNGNALTGLNRAINNFGVLGGGVVDARPGNMEPTGNPLDVAIEGSAFLAVQTPAGVRYTRNGSLQLSTTGQLQTSEGYPVLGDQGPITIPSGQVSLSTDGTFSVKGAIAGKLRLVEFAPGTELVPEGNSLFTVPAGAERPATDSQVRQGALESSNISPVTGAVNLIILQRHAEMLQRALSIFHTEFNRTAAEELPRV